MGYLYLPLQILSLGTLLSVLAQHQDRLGQVWQNTVSGTGPYCTPHERVLCQSPHYLLRLPDYPILSLTKEWLRKQAGKKQRE